MIFAHQARRLLHEATKEMCLTRYEGEKAEGCYVLSGNRRGKVATLLKWLAARQ